MRRYSVKFGDAAYRWLLFGEGRVHPPTPWRVTAWAFLLAGTASYLAAVWLLFTRRPWWALGAAAAGYLLRRQVRVVAPQLMERLALELGPEPPTDP